jgi:hypothetical protein
MLLDPPHNDNLALAAAPWRSSMLWRSNKMPPIHLKASSEQP